MTGTRRLTTAQAIVTFLQNQFVERDGQEHAFFAGMLGIFGHGNVAGVGQALQQSKFPYILMRNEQAAVHIASGYAKMSNRLRTFACTSSIGPGRNEHDYWRRVGHDQSPARAAAAWGHFRAP